MAIGDIGGPVTELCMTMLANGFIAKGDPVIITGNYTVESLPFLSWESDPRRIGFAMSETQDDQQKSIVVKIHGVSICKTPGAKDYPQGSCSYSGSHGLHWMVLKSDPLNQELHILH